MFVRRLFLQIISFGNLGLALLLVTITAPGWTQEQLSPLPPVPVPLDDPLTPSKVELGKLLYFDPRLSGDGTTSCASCHEPKLGWGDGADLSRGYPGTLHWRNSQTILNAAYLDKLFWAGGSPSLEAQAKSALTGPLAQNMNTLLAEQRLKQIPVYVKLFKEAYAQPPSFDGALKAIAAFERTIVSRNVPFDRYLTGDKSALTAEQMQGMALFSGKAGCIACHHGPLLTDMSFHNTGVPKHPAFEKEPLRQIAMRERIAAKGITEEINAGLDRDPGRYLETKNAEDKGKFRTAPLRELKYTAPYMHNGTLESLIAVVNFYDQGGGENSFATKSRLLKPLGLTLAEKKALVSFLESLSGDPIIVEAPPLPEYGLVPIGVTAEKK